MVNSSVSTMHRSVSGEEVQIRTKKKRMLAASSFLRFVIGVIIGEYHNH